MSALLTVHAGPLSAVYESGSLRYIKFEGKEILRRVYVALRDESWRTIPAKVIREVVETAADSFDVVFEAANVEGDIHFEWRLAIRGEANGSIHMNLAGEAKRSFRRNRIGFCVLHPIAGCAGQPCVVEHNDGSKEHSFFPEFVSPHQSFFDIRAISHEIVRGVSAEVRLSGDVFEIEDQRNWTDESFKIYSTPLSVPYPVTVQAGERIEQSVELRLVPSTDVPVEITVNRARATPVPQFGLAGDGDVGAGISYLRKEIDCRRQDWASALAEANQSHSPVEIAVFTDNFGDLAELKQTSRFVKRWLIFTSDGKITKPEAVLAARRALGPDAVIGGGSSTHFVELNRNREVIDLLDVVTWAANPTAHATDERTMIENLEGQAETVRSAQQFCGGRELGISPVRVPDIAAVESWIVGSISQLAQAGVRFVSYDRRSGIFAELEAFEPERVLQVRSSDPLRAYALAVGSGDRVRVWLANLTNGEQRILLDEQMETLHAHEVRAVDF